MKTEQILFIRGNAQRAKEIENILVKEWGGKNVDEFDFTGTVNCYYITPSGEIDFDNFNDLKPLIAKGIFKEYELPNFTVYDFKPFDKVIVADYNQIWHVDFFSNSIIKDDEILFVTVGGLWHNCLLFNEKNSKLIGKICERKTTLNDYIKTSDDILDVMIEKFNLKYDPVNNCYDSDVNIDLHCFYFSLTQDEKEEFITKFVKDGKMTLRFGKINGDFLLPGNLHNKFIITSLEGCPNYVAGNFNCSYNRLTSLKGCPNYVAGEFNCSNNQLTSLEGCPKKVNDDFENEIEKTKTKWHKIINGDLPKDNEVYVLHTIYNGVFTGWYENGKWWKPGFSPYSDDEVIAWCEAPKYEG